MSEDARDLVENAPCGLAVLDRFGLILEANAELLRLLGLDRGDVIGRRSLPSLVSVGGRIYFDTHIFPLLHLQGAVQEIALEVVRPDGTRVPVLFNANLVVSPDTDTDTDPDPDATRVRVALLEARDRRRYEADLLRAVRSAEEARQAAAEMATVLQQTLIPPRPPDIDGLTVAAAYRPAGDGSEVGGDFYDVFQVAEQQWVVVIGDVLGKGVGAATVTAFVRHTVRDLAMQVSDPAELLRRLDVAVASDVTEKFCSLVVARISRDDLTNGWSIVGSVGGHPLPLVRHPDGSVSELGTPGSLVGLFADPVFVTFEHLLHDDVVLFYTDGVIEAQSETELFGEQRLVTLLSEGEHDAFALTEDVVRTVLSFQKGDARDDVAVLAVQRTVRH